MKRKISFLLVFVLIMSLTIAGCAKNEGQAPAQGSGDEESGASEGKTAWDKVALVVAGGLGDRSFYDSSHEGVEKAKAELGIEYKVYECRNDPSLFNDQLVQASEYAPIVAVVGYEFFDLAQEIAGEFPDNYYIYVDNEIDGINNLITVSYAENEGSFLAGALAAMLTETKTIGMVGGMDMPVIRNFQVGYEAGAKYIDPEVKIETIYAEDFEDPAKGKEGATALYSKGADIVFQVAGKTGEGVFEAAKELGKFAIGVDTDQRYINPDVIIASMVKKVGLSIFDTIKNIQAGKVNEGEIVYYGLAEDGVGLGYGTDDMKQFATDEMKSKLDEIKVKIVNGEIEVPEAK